MMEKKKLGKKDDEGIIDDVQGMEGLSVVMTF